LVVPFWQCSRDESVWHFINMLTLGLKRTQDVAVEKPLKDEIFKLEHRLSAAQCSAAKEFQALRSRIAAIDAPSAEHRDLLLQYAAQVCHAENRLPGFGVPFLWSDSLDLGHVVALNEWAFEKASILYNIAVCCCSAAAQSDLGCVATVRLPTL
jgi:hypothetical protein